MLPHQKRLNPNEIKKVLNKGKKYRGEYGMLISVKANDKDSKFAFVVSKKIGNAVQRHRMTRILREITKEFNNEKSIKGVYVAFKYCDNYEELKKEFISQYIKATGDI